MSGRLVVFDLGRVLIRLCDNWKHACDLAGVTLPDNLPQSDAATLARQQEAAHLFDMGKVDLAEFSNRVAACRGVHCDQVIAIQNAYLLGPYPGAIELIDDLHNAGHTTACLSNTNANHWRIMNDPADAHATILSRLHHRFGSHLLG